MFWGRNSYNVGLGLYVCVRKYPLLRKVKVNPDMASEQTHCDKIIIYLVWGTCWQSIGCSQDVYRISSLNRVTCRLGWFTVNFRMRELT